MSAFNASSSDPPSSNVSLVQSFCGDEGSQVSDASEEWNIHGSSSGPASVAEEEEEVSKRQKRGSDSITSTLHVTFTLQELQAR